MRIPENNLNNSWQLSTVGLILSDMKLAEVGYIFFSKCFRRRGSKETDTVRGSSDSCCHELMTTFHLFIDTI